jgi:hypothetical protein
MKRPTAVAVSLTVFSLFFVPTNRCGAELIHVVSPSAYADAESGGGVLSPNPVGKYQQVFPASDFQSLPADAGTITEFAYRPDGNLTTPLQGGYTAIVVKLSTTSAIPGSLSMTFADNVGNDEVVVFSGTDVDSSTQNSGPDGGPKIFDMVIPLQTPFEYDPSQGNLLMEVSFTYEGGFSADMVNDAGLGQQLIGSNEFSGSTATFNMGGFVTQFTVVPEPSTITLFTMAGMVGAFVAWRKRKRT